MIAATRKSKAKEAKRGDIENTKKKKKDKIKEKYEEICHFISSSVFLPSMCAQKQAASNMHFEFFK